MHTASVNNSLEVVSKLDRLFNGITRHKKYLKSSFKDLYYERFDHDFLEKPDTWLNYSVSSSSNSDDGSPETKKLTIQIQSVTEYSEEQINENNEKNQPQEVNNLINIDNLSESNTDLLEEADKILESKSNN